MNNPSDDDGALETTASRERSSTFGGPNVTPKASEVAQSSVAQATATPAPGRDRASTFGNGSPAADVDSAVHHDHDEHEGIDEDAAIDDLPDSLLGEHAPKPKAPTLDHEHYTGSLEEEVEEPFIPEPYRRNSSSESQAPSRLDEPAVGSAQIGIFARLRGAVSSAIGKVRQFLGGTPPQTGNDLLQRNMAAWSAAENGRVGESPTPETASHAPALDRSVARAETLERARTATQGREGRSLDRGL